MKLTVVADAEGNIVATARFDGDKGAPQHAAVIGPAGHNAYEVEVPSEVARLESAMDLHQALRLEPLSRSIRVVRK